MSFGGEIILDSLHIPHLIIKVRKPILVIWFPPSSNIIKLNVDGTAKGNPGVSGTGGVFRDSSGVVIYAFSSYLGVKSNNFAECSVLLIGLRIAYHLDINKLQVKSDSLLLVQWFQFKASIP